MNNDKRIVVHIMTSFGGGISSFIYNKALYFANDRSVEFNVITFDDVSKEFNEAIHNTGGKVIKIIAPNSKNIFKFINMVDLTLKEFPKEIIVHSHFGMNLAIIFRILTLKNGIKNFIIHAHTNSPFRMNNFKKNLNNKLSTLKLTCGKSAARNFFGENAADEAIFIPNSIDVSKFLEEKSKVKMRKSILGNQYDEKIVIGHIGRFHSVKNHKFMIDIIQELVNQDINFKWIFVGSGELENNIKKIISERNLTNYVEFLGRREDAYNIYKILDFFVLPSLYEGLSIVAIEAQTSGVYSLLSENVARESNLGVNLVEYLPINNVQIWVEKIIQNINYPKVTPEIRLESVRSKKFSNKESGELYKTILFSNAK